MKSIEYRENKLYKAKTAKNQHSKIKFKSEKNKEKI